MGHLRQLLKCTREATSFQITSATGGRSKRRHVLIWATNHTMSACSMSAVDREEIRAKVQAHAWTLPVMVNCAASTAARTDAAAAAPRPRSKKALLMFVHQWQGHNVASNWAATNACPHQIVASATSAASTDVSMSAKKRPTLLTMLCTTITFMVENKNYVSSTR